MHDHGRTYETYLRLDMPNKSWFHVVLTFYGNWLPGDPRGFRTKKHKKHIEGDYKNPPPKDLYKGLYEASLDSLKQPKMLLLPSQQIIVGEAFLETFQAMHIPILAIAVSRTHLHMQAEFETKQVRNICGKGKKNSWHRLCEHNWKGKLWAKGGKYLPIKDYSHHKNTHNYLLKHASENAWVWKWNKTGGCVIHIPS